MSGSSWRFVAFAGGTRPTDPVALADFLTSVADLRAAVCLEAGVHPDYISSLGYDHSVTAYLHVRSGWVRHVAQFGLSMFDRNLDGAFALWQEARPDLTAGDDWRAACAAAHKADTAVRCCFLAERGGTCVICEGDPDLS